jgi:hypothetical protein
MVKKLIFLSVLVCCLPIKGYSTVSEGWEKHIIGPQSSPIYLAVKDMDGDGDPDVASTTGRHPLIWDSEVAWFRNNLDQGAPWDKFIISSSAPEDNPLKNTNGIVISDIDGDGREDVVVGTGNVIEPVVGNVYWFKAPEDPTGEWQRFDIEAGSANSYFKMCTMDVNEDSMPDIIAGGRKGAAIFINPGTPDEAGALWEKISFPGDTGSALYLDDLDQDGRPDVVNTLLHGNVSWFAIAYENGEVVLNRTMIDEDLDNAFDVNCMDINGDGRKDVIVTTLNQPNIYWYEAPANSGEPWIRHDLSTTYSGTDIYTEDINGDQQTDVVVSGAFSDKIAWFEFEWKAGEAVWTEHMIDDLVDDPGDVSLDDLDGDGDLDVVVTGLREDQMLWYENKIPKPTLCPLEFLLGKESPRLETFRTIRDRYVVAVPGGRRLVASYYAHAAEMTGFLERISSVLTLNSRRLIVHGPW